MIVVLLVEEHRIEGTIRACIDFSQYWAFFLRSGKNHVDHLRWPPYLVMLPVVFTESPHQQATSSLSLYINHLQNGSLWLLVLPHGDNFLQVCLVLGIQSESVRVCWVGAWQHKCNVCGNLCLIRFLSDSPLQLYNVNKSQIRAL